VPASNTAAKAGPIAIDEIWAARERISGRVKHTPLDSSRSLSVQTGVPIYLKLENLQHTGSYKPRGALNAIETLPEEEKRAGVVTLSAGNWAQAVALAATAAGVKSAVVMPAAAVSVKVAATIAYGAEAILHGANSMEMEAEARRIAAERGMRLLSPFDNRPMMAGHGTLGLEILEALPELGTIFVPVGGGSLIAGVGSAIKALSPATRVVGVSAEGAAAVYRSLQAGEVVEIPEVNTIADGLAVKRPGAVGVAIGRQVVDEIVLVSDAAIRSAMAWALEREKVVLEPAGATALAALMSGRVKPSGPTAFICSGGNIELSRLIELVTLGTGPLRRRRER
jgi:threonine dehydratase